MSASARAIDKASVSDSMASAIAMGNSSRNEAIDRSGADSGGRPSGSAASVSMPVRADPSHRLSSTASTLPTSKATIMWGTRGVSLRASTLTNKVVTATSVTQGLM